MTCYSSYGKIQQRERLVYVERRESSGAEEIRYTADELLEMMSDPETGTDEEDDEEA